MTITAVERALFNVIRPTQLQRRNFLTSWEDVAFVNRSVGPALDLTFDKLDDYIPVSRWRSGNPRLGHSEVASDTYGTKVFFYGTEFHIPGWEQWLRDNAVQQPNAALFPDLNNARYNEQRRVRAHVEEMERTWDNDFYAGHDDIAFPGMLALDASPDSLSADFTTADGSGRREFIETLVSLNADASDAFTRGARRKLVIGEGAWQWAALPLDPDTNGYTGPSLESRLRGMFDQVVVSQNPAMKGKAFVHWESQDNVEVFDMTPDGVVIRAEANRIDGLRVRMFSMWGAVEHRGGTVQVIDGLLP